MLAGSHLDSQPNGGNFDGVYGVLAALEVLEALDDGSVETDRPIEVVVWTNEEGARFQPTTMGSAVYVGALPLQQALAARSKDGMTVSEALAFMHRKLPHCAPRALATPLHAYVEAELTGCSAASRSSSSTRAKGREAGGLPSTTSRTTRPSCCSRKASSTTPR